MESENKKKYVHWLHPSTIKLAEDAYGSNNCASRSEFVEKAILFYIGYISEKTARYFCQNRSSQPCVECSMIQKTACQLYCSSRR